MAKARRWSRPASRAGPGRAGAAASGAGVEPILELIGVLSGRDDDVHLAGQTGELASSRPGHHLHAQALGAAVQDALVVEREGARLAAELAGHQLDGDV